MCFSQPASLGFAIMGFGTAAILRARGHSFRRYQLFAYFAIMEVIQFLSYFVVDQCDNPINKVLTMLAFTHLMYQVRASPRIKCASSGARDVQEC
jgi:ABC-type molybdate transport system ATPase subunit